MKPKKKKILLRLFFVLFLLLALLAYPLTETYLLFALPSQYDETYYGELSPMTKALRESKKKKIVVVGNSSVCFGLDSTRMEEELSGLGYDYDVISFGLYGSIGTKAMMELSRDEIHKNDIVLFSPEWSFQSLSLYFSGDEMWYCLDSDLSLLSSFEEKEKKEVFGSLNTYLGKKASAYYSGKKPSSGTVYSRASFDENQVLRNTLRENNKMANGYDSNNLIELKSDLLSSDFVSYVKEYVKDIQEKGASIYFSFSPMNRKAIPVSYLFEDTLSSFTETVEDTLGLRLLSSPMDSIMEEGYFYDSNFHLNETGMEYHTLKLTEALLNEWKDDRPLSHSYPEAPALPKTNNKGEGDEDNSDLSYFNLTQKEDATYELTSLTEEGKSKSKLTLPSSYQGGKITSFRKTLFQNDTALQEVIIPKSITFLSDSCFSGCSSLEKIILRQDNPESLQVGYELLDGASHAKIYVPSSSLSSYLNDYFWGHYGQYLLASGE